MKIGDFAVLEQKFKGITDAQTSPHSMTYAEMAVEETRRREGSIPTIIDVTATTVTSQTDGETL